MFGGVFLFSQLFIIYKSIYPMSSKYKTPGVYLTEIDTAIEEEITDTTE